MVFVLLTAVMALAAQEQTGDNTAQADTASTNMQADSSSSGDAQPHKLSLIRRIVRGFDRLDERYIEPQHYVFTMMMQATQNLDIYTMGSGGDARQTFTFAAEDNVKIGPYFGWKWFFAGYTFDLHDLNLSHGWQGLDLSVYSSQIGVDVFYRRTRANYKLTDAKLGDNIDTTPLEGISFKGMKSGITGLNLYYIFNHGRFSYPAAFAQSTQQKMSCGSWMAGFGYTRNALDFDPEELQRVVDERLAPQTVSLDSSLLFKSVRYLDYNVSMGYAYNWVFAPQWLLGAGVQAALAYKKTISDMADKSARQGFNIENVNLNAIGRFGLVYNNMRWYAGFSAVVRMNNYRNQHFYTSNVFGSLNLYAGYNFGLKKKYRKKE